MLNRAISPSGQMNSRALMSRAKSFATWLLCSQLLWFPTRNRKNSEFCWAYLLRAIRCRLIPRKCVRLVWAAVVGLRWIALSEFWRRYPSEGHQYMGKCQNSSEDQDAGGARKPSISRSRWWWEQVHYFLCSNNGGRDRLCWQCGLGW